MHQVPTPKSIPTHALQALGKEELTKAAKLFGTLKALRLRLLDTDELSLDRSFQTHTTAVLEKLNHRLLLLGEINPSRRIEIIMAKHGLYDAAFQQVIVLNQNVSPLLGESLQELRSVHLQFLSEFQSCIGDYMNAMNTQRKEVALDKASTDVLKDECTQLLESVRLLDGEAEKRHEEIVELRRKLRLLEQKNSELEMDLKATRGVMRMNGGSVSPSRPLVMDTSVPAYHKFMQPKSRVFSPASTATSANSSISALATSTVSSRSQRVTAPSSPTKQFQPQPPQQPSTSDWFYSFRVELQAVMDSGKCRIYSENECKEVIEKLYFEKHASERRSKVVETMEFHVYRSMEKRYGLRSLAIEHTGSLIRSTEQLAARDCVINVFYKTFRNEIEEDYRFVQEELGRSIRELLNGHVAANFPTKDKAFVSRMFDKKMEGTVTETEWNDVIKYLYNGADSTALNVILRRQARDEKHARSNTGKGKDLSATVFSFSAASVSTSFQVKSPAKGKSHRTDAKTPPAPMELSTATFIKTVLDFQLHAHENFLLAFRQAFNAADSDHDGVLSRDEFLACWRRLREGERTKPPPVRSAKQYVKGPGKAFIIRPGNDGKAHGDNDANSEAEHEDVKIFLKVLAIVDPLGTKKITFSTAASGISKFAESSV